MKTALWFTVLTIFLSLSLHAQDVNKKIIDDRFDKEILIGYCDRAGLQEGEFGESYSFEYEDYEPARKLIKKIGRNAVDYNIVIVLATWCGDSEEQIPRFYRILDDAGLSDEMLQLVCVDGQKAGGDVPVQEYEIERVPTFIFFRDGIEIGRITETPEKTLEKDMWRIIK
ncbi:MAG: thioredoxin family protein [Bacteroidetes bacterium]|nr:thioredoxin family protein [Bacteroidota bacterium]